MPDCLYDASTAWGFGVDVMFQLNRVALSTSSGPLIRLAGWTNLHWSHLRLDDAGTYAIDAVVPVGDTGRSFVIDRFTYDSKGRGRGLFRFDLKASNHGVIAFRNGRVEVNDNP
jgi:hypothetical protein